MGVVILETLRIPPDDFAYNARLAPNRTCAKNLAETGGEIDLDNCEDQ